VGGCGERTAHQARGDLCGQAHVAHGHRRQQGVNGIPTRVDTGHLVGEELHAVHETRRHDHHGVGEGFEPRGQHHVTGGAEYAEHGDGGVHIDTTRPRDAHADGNDLCQIHAVLRMRKCFLPATH
jgi:hypothetical protein